MKTISETTCSFGKSWRWWYVHIVQACQKVNADCQISLRQIIRMSRSSTYASGIIALFVQHILHLPLIYIACSDTACIFCYYRSDHQGGRMKSCGDQRQWWVYVCHGTAPYRNAFMNKDSRDDKSDIREGCEYFLMRTTWPLIVKAQYDSGMCASIYCG